MLTTGVFGRCRQAGASVMAGCAASALRDRRLGLPAGRLDGGHGCWRAAFVLLFAPRPVRITVIHVVPR